MRTKLFVITALFLLASLAFGQASKQGGRFVAANYKYNATISTGFTGTGAQTMTIAYGSVVLPDGRSIVPFATNAPITVGVGASAETVTPSAVSGCTKSRTYNVCTVTATFTYAHGAGDPVVSGTAGLQEAINDANAVGGGIVVIDPDWTAGGGNATLYANATWTGNVQVEDARGGKGYQICGTGTTCSKTTVSPIVVIGKATMTSASTATVLAMPTATTLALCNVSNKTNTLVAYPTYSGTLLTLTTSAATTADFNYDCKVY